MVILCVAEEAEEAMPAAGLAEEAVAMEVVLGATEETLRDMEVVAVAAVQVHRPGAAMAVMVQFGYD